MIQSLFLILTSGTNTLLGITLQIKLFEHVSKILTECSCVLGVALGPKDITVNPMHNSSDLTLSLMSFRCYLKVTF